MVSKSKYDVSYIGLICLGRHMQACVRVFANAGEGGARPSVEYSNMHLNPKP
jgi:hypothetical protein